jgi:RNA polymerase sigma-70 factor, ECF subfamily
VTDESELVRHIQTGDRKAFEVLLDRYEARVYRLALRYADCVADAEDLTQEVFLGIYRNIGGFRGAAALSTWIYRVAVNHCLEYRRRKRPETVVYDDDDELPTMDWRHDPVQVSTKNDIAAQLERALEHLTPIHRDVVVLHEIQGLTYQECADVLEIPVGTVKSRLFNAFCRLRELLKGYVCEGS